MTVENVPLAETLKSMEIVHTNMKDYFAELILTTMEMGTKDDNLNIGDDIDNWGRGWNIYRMKTRKSAKPSQALTECGSQGFETVYFSNISVCPRCGPSWPGSAKDVLILFPYSKFASSLGSSSSLAIFFYFYLFSSMFQGSDQWKRLQVHAVTRLLFVCRVNDVNVYCASIFQKNRGSPGCETTPSVALTLWGGGVGVGLSAAYQSNKDILWKSTFSDGRFTKYSTTCSMPVDDGHDNISLAPIYHKMMRIHLHQQGLNTRVLLPSRNNWATQKMWHVA